jgi:hypothetical protein
MSIDITTIETQIASLRDAIDKLETAFERYNALREILQLESILLRQP